MLIEPEIGGCTIVLLGAFSPLAFSPRWFALNGIITDEQADAAQVTVLHNDLSVFRVGKFSLQIEDNRFAADTTEAPWIDLCDFVGRTFSELLPLTPINQMGINRLVHFSVGSEENRNRIGNTFAPLEPWGEWGKAIAAAPPSMRGGCVNLTMLQAIKEDDYHGHFQITIQPSSRIKGNAGIYAQTNDHYDVGPLDKTGGSALIMKLLVERFETSLRRSEAVIDHVMRLGENK